MALHPGRLRSLVVGSGGAAFPLRLSGVLKNWVEAPDLEAYRGTDPRQIVADALTNIERYALPGYVREDYLSSYQGDRFVESMRYMRAYPTDLPILCDLLPRIQTPLQIIAGRRDPAVPPVNAEFLHQRLPNSKLDIIGAGHFPWEIRDSMQRLHAVPAVLVHGRHNVSGPLDTAWDLHRARQPAAG
ncbi:MAG TPA: alpha/beta hydrolase [Pseudonocardia sp.]|uniref:alpha/beta hydrolase n=1 Tax=Pseudonocardia sp. TaxID=60912 RepID=UPI002C56713C|nr:alpha/beta hydrolase [Pseudonocardia sp.]HTF54716.1 alpha/beta hydrolase [Pseudonocardia sp.]